MNDQMMRTVPEQTINSMQSQFESFEKEPVLLQLLGQQVKSYNIKFIADNKTRHEIISCGMINKIPVLIQIT
jgi:hypothetical protein